MEALESRHPRDMKRVSIIGAGLLKRIGSLHVDKSGDRTHAGEGAGRPGSPPHPLLKNESINKIK